MSDSVEATSEEQQSARAEFEEARVAAAGLDPASISDGTWFTTVIRLMLESYADKVVRGGGVGYFRKRYPGLPRDQIAEKLCGAAARYAALAGAMSGAATSAAAVMTIGTAGLGAPAIAVGGSALAGEIVYTTRLQVRLVYDLSTLYGFPIDPKDPDDLVRVFAMAYGVPMAVGSVGQALKGAGPEVGRAAIRKVLHGHQAALSRVALRVLGPKIGKKITQGAIIKTMVPGVGVGIATSWNYVSTASLGRVARAAVQSRAALRTALARVSQDLVREPNNVGFVLEAVHRVATADEEFSEREIDLYNDVFQATGGNVGVRDNLEARIGMPLSATVDGLRSFVSPELKASLAEVLELVAIADGVIDPVELATLSELNAALGHPVDAAALEVRAARFRSPEGAATRAGRAIRDAATSGGRALRDAASSAAASVFGRGGSAQRAPAGNDEGAVEPPVPSVASQAPPPATNEQPVGEEERRMNAVMARLQKLVAMHEAGIITDDDVKAQRARILAEL
jgi:uncharacterized protein (DUF697 family)